MEIGFGFGIGLYLQNGGQRIVGKLPGYFCLSNVNKAQKSQATEYSYEFLSNSHKFVVRSRLGATLRLAFTANGTNDGGDYFTIDGGASYNFDMGDIGGQTVYLRSSSNSDTAEIIYTKNP